MEYNTILKYIGAVNAWKGDKKKPTLTRFVTLCLAGINLDNKIL